MLYDLIIRDALVIDGSNTPGVRTDVAIGDGRIQRIGSLTEARAREEVNAAGRVLAPGFIDVHTHDDTVVIRKPDMLPKISQGVTTVIVGNCGISASPVSLRGNPPDPMNLLGDAAAFVYPRFTDYRAAVDNARPAVNVAALIGHTALRSNHMDDLFRSASPEEIAAMREQLRDSLEAGALGLSTGLAYASAFSAETSEVKQLAEELSAFGAIYTTHLRSEFEPVLEAMAEAFDIGRHARSPVIISHMKCAGAGNWGRSPQLLAALEKAAQDHPVAATVIPMQPVPRRWILNRLPTRSALPSPGQRRTRIRAAGTCRTLPLAGGCHCRTPPASCSLRARCITAWMKAMSSASCPTRCR